MQISGLPFQWHTDNAAGHGLHQGGSQAPQWEQYRSATHWNGAKLKVTRGFIQNCFHVDLTPVSKIPPTCWQMLAYRARTLAFSKIASSDGVVLLIFSTQRHLAKSAPSFLYCAQRSDSPSRPALQHAQSTPSETGKCLVSSTVFRASYLEWLSPHLFQREGQHLCPPVETKQKWWIELHTAITRENSAPRKPGLMLREMSFCEYLDKRF